MKTAITIINTVQTGIDSWLDFKTTKVFDDDTKIGEIKEWIGRELELECDIDEIGLSSNIISDVK